MEISEMKTYSENDDFSSDLSKRNARILLFAILAFSLFLQVVYIDKFESEPDDEYIVTSSLLIYEGYKPFFTNYSMPGIWLYSIPLNIGLAVPHIHELNRNISAGKKQDALKIISQSRSDFFTNMVEIHNKLRWINAFAVIGAVLFVYSIAFRLTDSRLLGIFSALIFGTSPLMVRWGTNFHPEQFMGFFGAGCVYYCIGHVMKKGKNQLLYASIFCALAFASKINAVVFTVPLAASVFFGSKDIPAMKRIISLFYCTAIMFITFYVVVPFLFNDPAQFLKNLMIASNHYQASGLKSWMDTGIVMLFRYIFGNSGFVISALAVYGAVYALYKRSLALLLIPVSIISFILLHTLFTILSARHTLTLIPLTSVLAGMAIGYIPKKLKYRNAAMTLVVLVALIQPAIKTQKVIAERANGDTRTLARNWVYENLPAGSKVLLSYSAPRINYGRKSIDFWKSYLGDRLTKNRQGAFPVEFLRDSVLNEEKYYYKKFCYLAERENLPAPGYEVFEQGYIPEDITLAALNEDLWLLGNLPPNKIDKEIDAGNRVAMKIKERGKLVAEFSNKDKMGENLYIYRVEAEKPAEIPVRDTIE